MQVIIVELGGSFMETIGLKWYEWLACIGLGSLSLPVGPWSAPALSLSALPLHHLFDPSVFARALLLREALSSPAAVFAPPVLPNVSVAIPRGAPLLPCPLACFC